MAELQGEWFDCSQSSLGANWECNNRPLTRIQVATAEL